MAKKYRKPIPKSQKEIAEDLQTPYDESRTNPSLNTPVNDQTNLDFLRGEKLSFTDDTVKPMSIGIKDIDESIMYYFNEVIKPFVVNNNERIAVPVIYGNPEKWKSFQKDSYLRDDNGALLCPLIMFKRDSIDNNNSLSRNLDANSPLLYTTTQKNFNSKNFYSNFNILNNSVPTKQYIVNVIPNYVNITYSCVVQTYYVEQLNKIVEAINYASNSYWGDPSRFKFRANIDSFSTVVEFVADKNRVAKSSFTIKMYGYLLPDVPQKDLNSIKKFNSKSKLTFQTEAVSQIPTQSNVTPDGRKRDI